MKTIQLTGRLGKLYGRKHRLDVHSPAEAIRALCYLFPSFEEELKQGSYIVHRLYEDGFVNIGKELLHLAFGEKSLGIKIVPVVKSAKSGFFQIILGALLVGAAFILTGGTLSATAFSVFGMSVTGGQLALFGGLMALAGVSSMLAPKMSTDTMNANKSYVIDAPQNNSTQGGAVPLIYGFGVFVGSTTIADGIYTEEYEPEDDDDSDTSATALSSLSTIRIIDLLGEGPIGGLSNASRSVFLNEIPLRNSDGSKNFKGVKYELKTGTQSQNAFKGFPQATNEVGLGVPLTNVTPVTFTVNDADTDAVVVKIRIPQLTEFGKAKGTLLDQTVSFKFEVKTASGSFAFVGKQMDIVGHTQAPYERARRIELEAGGAPWTIRVTRLTTDNIETNIQNQSYVSSYTLIYDAKVAYQDRAVIMTSWDGMRFGNQIASRIYQVDGLYCKVPSNWNPSSRNYSGAWDGTFVDAIHDNPVWVLYDLMIKNRYGLGDYLAASQIDKFGLYAIAQYCDGLVNGEPRFRFRGVIKDRFDAAKLLDTITAIFRGMIYWSAGTIIATNDAPGTPVKLVGPANTIDGQFVYTGSADKARHTSVIVQYSDPDNFGKPAYEVVQRDRLIASRPDNQTSITAIGCYFRNQAIQTGEWLLDTEENQTDAVKWTASMDQADLRPGQLINLADPSYQNGRFSGRVMDVYYNQITAPNDLSDAAWTKFHTTINTNATRDWQYALTADKIIEDGGNNTHTVYYSKTCSNGDRVIAQVLMKAAGRTKAYIQLSDFTSNVAETVVDLSAGTLTQPANTPGFQNTSASIKDLGDGWYKVTLRATKNNGDPDANLVIGLMNGALTSYLGDGASGVHVSWAQWEKASVASPLVRGEAILMDYPFDPTPVTYSISCVLPDGSIDARTITGWQYDGINENIMASPNKADAAIYTKTALSVTADIANDWQNNGNADKLVPNTSNTLHNLLQLLTLNNNTQYCYWGMFKAVETHFVSVRMGNNAGNSISAIFDLALGKVTTAAAATTDWTNVSSGIIQQANGYYLCWVSGKKGSLNNSLNCTIDCCNNSGATTFAGNGVDGVLVAWQQLEHGSAPSQDFVSDEKFSLIELATPFGQTPQNDAMFVLTSPNINPRQFRVVSNSEKKENLYEIAALFHDPTKYARVERGRNVKAPDYTTFRTGALRKPTDLNIFEWFRETGRKTQPYVTLSWSQPGDDARVTGYEYQIMTSEKKNYSRKYVTSTTSIDYGPVTDGWLQFRVRSTGVFATSSEWVEKRISLINLNQPMPDVSKFTIDVTDGGIANFKWVCAGNQAMDGFEIRHSPKLTGAKWSSARVYAKDIDDSKRDYSGILREGTFLIKAVAYGGRYSKNAKSVTSEFTDIISQNITDTVSESPGWKGMNIQGMVPVSGGVGADDLRDPFWTKHHCTIASGEFGFSKVLEAADVQVHGVEREFDVYGRQLISPQWAFKDFAGRNAQITVSDGLGNALTYVINVVAGTIVSSSNVGNMVVKSAAVVSALYKYFQLSFYTVNECQSITLETYSHNGTTQVFLGDVTKGIDYLLGADMTNASLIKDEGTLRLKDDNGPYMSSWAALDDVQRLSGFFITEAYYTFQNKNDETIFDTALDFGAPTTARFYVDFDFDILAPTYLMSDWNALSDIPNMDNSKEGVTIAMQVRTSTSLVANAMDYSWTEWNDITDAAYTLRYAQFRIHITSVNPLITPLISSAIITVDMKDRVLSDKDLSCPAAGLDIDFAPPFMIIPAVAVNGQSLNTGDYHLISAKSKSGFTVRFFNAAGTGVVRTFDWIAKGYGKDYT